jgi:hypothetical protein
MMMREGGKPSAVTVIFGKTTKYDGRYGDKPFVMFLASYIQRSFQAVKSSD